MYGDRISIMYHYVSMSRSFSISIDASPFLYSSGYSVVVNVSCMKRRDSLPNIAMCADVICNFVWTRRYVASMHVFPINISFMAI